MASTVQELDQEQLKCKLTALAKEISAELSRLESGQSKELLSDFVSELYLSAADQRRKQERRQRQAECIAAAKDRGVRFGRARTPLPDDFGVFHRAWRRGEMTLSQAAETCGMTRSSFYNAALREERSDSCAG